MPSTWTRPLICSITPASERWTHDVCASARDAAGRRSGLTRRQALVLRNPVMMLFRTCHQELSHVLNSLQCKEE
jgi:hypothetical protein